HDGILSLFGTWVSDTELGEGWFGADLGVSTMYRYGYFEASVKCSYIEKRGTGDFWSAFWIQATDPYTPEQSQGGIGPGGMELDIMENFGPDYTTCCFWSAGVEGREGLVNELYQICDTGKNYHDEYHTYSLLWDEEAYSVFVDGVLIAHTDYYYGTARVPEEVRLTLCPRNSSNYEKDDTREMCVDYVRIWQKPDSEAVGSGS
ncbi:MAG: glycoside hydrolase family 16 protein, partial [Candidatus Methanomethylophilaceae archaeon]|nr:glycoside hydrolase family 16 protein [Candidatus Methanomethylophilaceae archaeon]